MRASEFLNIDCMDKDKGMPSYPDKYFDLAIVDPPYGTGCEIMNITATPSFRKNKRVAKREDKNWDVVPTKEYFDELFRVSKNQIIWGANYFEGLKRSRCWIFWDKKYENTFNFSAGELAWTSFNMPLQKVSVTNRVMPHNLEFNFHPTSKPKALYTWLLNKFAKQGDLILDTHVGSASSLIACEDLGFDYVGYELDADYYKSACKRIEQFRSQLKLSL